MCAMASFPDYFNHPSTTASVQVMNMNWFVKESSGNDEVSLTFKISADLQLTFTWSTKQVFVFLMAEYETPGNSLNLISMWDSVIPSKERSKFNIHTKSKYRLIDQGSNLRGKEFNLTLHWHVMSKSGKLFADKIMITGHCLPVDYR